MAFGEIVFIQLCEASSHPGMNDGCSRLDDDRDLIAVAVDEPVEGHVASFSSPWLRTTDAPRHRLFGAPGQSSKEGLNEKEYVLFMQQIIRKANHGALKNPLFRCVIVSVPAFCHWCERTPLGPSCGANFQGGYIMLKILTALAASLAMLSAAAAADLPRREPPPPAAPPVGKWPVGKAPIGKTPPPAPGVTKG